ncbi:invertebrate-type lysozyme 3-like isoform X2 [Bactrocera oleae]|uniref:invertebrate-type lysozyme 3-like isoform X2 n=1 Tax=Bactrocera oleae TaxID=104688 RepID=UPI00174E413D|nr:invertebrate-type lysozyme 3-like [Bactrocera oleae]
MLINAQEKPVTDVCLGCLCEATSGCNSTAACTGDVCGLYRISWPYWSDGGKLTLNGESSESERAYANCVSDPSCAANTIQNYMTKYAQDCNGDNQVDCFDYAVIHKLGGLGCTGELGNEFQTTLASCLNLS